MSTDDRPTTESWPSAAGTAGASASGMSQTRAPRVLSEFGRLLTETDCPTCRHIAETGLSFFSWFEIESHTGSEMLARLRAAMGMCPAQTRRPLESPGTGQL